MNDIRRTYLSTASLILTMVTALAGCIFQPDGDTGRPPSLPTVLSISLTDGEIVDSRSLTVIWSGNQTAQSYRYSLDGGENLTTTETLADFSDLDDGQHVFTLKAISDSLGTESKTVVLTFIVDAYKGPGVTFTPRRLSSQSTVTINLENMPGIMAAHIVITADKDCVDFGTFTPAPVSDDGVTTINFTSIEPGTFVIDIGFAGKPDGLTGNTIPVGTLTMSPVRSGTVRCDAERTLLRNTDNTNITVKDADYITITP